MRPVSTFLYKSEFCKFAFWTAPRQVGLLIRTARHCLHRTGRKLYLKSELLGPRQNPRLQCSQPTAVQIQRTAGSTRAVSNDERQNFERRCQRSIEYSQLKQPTI